MHEISDHITLRYVKSSFSAKNNYLSWHCETSSLWMPVSLSLQHSSSGIGHGGLVGLRAPPLNDVGTVERVKP